MTKTLIVEDRTPRGRLLTLDRPEGLNALNCPTPGASCEPIRNDSGRGCDIGVIEVPGTGRELFSGSDRKWLADGRLADGAAHMRDRDAERMGQGSLAVRGSALHPGTMQLADGIARSDADALTLKKFLARRALEFPLKNGLWFDRFTQHRYRNETSSMLTSIREFAQHGKAGPAVAGD